MIQGHTRTAKRRFHVRVAMCLALSMSLATPGVAAQTRAGTAIVNTGSLTSGPVDMRTTIDSNSVTLRVDATIDVAVVARADTVVVKSGATGIPVAFIVTNQGNSGERFTLTASAGGSLVFATDDDRDGVYDPAQDRGTELTLAPAESRTVFVIVPGPVAATTAVTLTATATTGIGAPGTVFAGAGPNGVDAVVGTTGGSASAVATVTIGTAQPALVKSQSVVAPDGTARATSGAIITYQLEARFPAATRNAAIADVVPAGTRYLAGSITVDGRPLTDARDTDAASFDGTTVRVTLGDVAATTIRTIRFQTTID